MYEVPGWMERGEDISWSRCSQGSERVVLIEWDVTCISLTQPKFCTSCSMHFRVEGIKGNGGGWVRNNWVNLATTKPRLQCIKPTSGLGWVSGERHPVSSCFVSQAVYVQHINFYILSWESKVGHRARKRFHLSPSPPCLRTFKHSRSPHRILVRKLETTGLNDEDVKGINDISLQRLWSSNPSEYLRSPVQGRVDRWAV